MRHFFFCWFFDRLSLREGWRFNVLGGKTPIRVGAAGLNWRYRTKQCLTKFSSVKIFVTSEKFCHFCPMKCFVLFGFSLYFAWDQLGIIYRVKENVISSENIIFKTIYKDIFTFARKVSKFLQFLHLLLIQLMNMIWYEDWLIKRPGNYFYESNISAIKNICYILTLFENLVLDKIICRTKIFVDQNFRRTKFFSPTKNFVTFVRHCFVR